MDAGKLLFTEIGKQPCFPDLSGASQKKGFAVPFVFLDNAILAS
jgi:hypothetical protein